jgi:hypothetical protein
MRHNKKKARETPLPFFFIDKLPLTGGDCFYGTNPRAAAAIGAFFGIDPAAIVFFGNCFHRTFTVAGAAINTLLAYFVRHRIPLCIMVWDY